MGSSAINVTNDDADMQSFTARKTVTGGALGMGLIASNVDQLMTIVDKIESGIKLTDKVKLGLLVASITFQVMRRTSQLKAK